MSNTVLTVVGAALYTFENKYLFRQHSVSEQWILIKYTKLIKSSRRSWLAFFAEIFNYGVII